VTPTAGAFTTTPTLNDTWPAPGGAAVLNFGLNFAGTTQFGTDSTVNALSQDGYAPGRLSGINIDQSGVVFARYSNGQALTLGQVALANFSNPQGLAPVGNTAWAESFDSGQPIVGSPQSGARGSVQAGALEDSNVDISSQLVNLILAQRNYQANAKTIETSNAVTQTIINLR
jgi:flagellar hook protein FlgE